MRTWSGGEAVKWCKVEKMPPITGARSLSKFFILDGGADVRERVFG